MNGLTEINGIAEKNQESQENTLCNGKQNPAGAGTSGISIKQGKVMGNKQCAGRTSEAIAINGSVAGTAEMTGAWGK